MSTKIYDGMCCRADKFFNEVLLRIRKKVFNNAVAKIKSHLNFDVATTIAERNHIYSFFNKLKAVSKSLSRDPLYDIDFSMNLWVDKHFVYIVPYGERDIYLGIKNLTHIEDFSYWDNSDMPDEMFQSEWTRRRKTWEKLCLNDHNKTRLQHIVISIKEGIGEYELRKKFLGEEYA